VWAVFWVIIAAMVPLLLFAITAPPMLRFLWL
jgi:hypothetical protein